MKFMIRAAREQDCVDIHRMIMELAVYEKMADQVKISHEELQRDGFGLNPFYQCLIAEVPKELKSEEGKGVGKALMASVAQVCVDQQCVRLQFAVLDWNKPSLGFYLSKGAEDLTVDEGWHVLRFHGPALKMLADEAP
ncbi:diamine acetyltransferase 2b isoform X2 [Tachysurus fulvidraco]|uniref:diamine acetyltransferase 2b isoform X2 n=1 Tax=Tachysurus fulvidraco TaxID=1234273 RepID=UPI001FEF7478|nr:diamine acetyltransferase 2b isoform X2 [Tachysurus fulvidraco]